VIGSPVTVRKSAHDEFPRVAAALGRSFHDDPVMQWMFPKASPIVATIARFFLLRMRALADQDEIYTTDDHAGGAVWSLPGRWRLSPPREALFALRVLPMVGFRGAHLARGWHKVDVAHPEDPHYYLAILGTEPDMQGRGIGSALMQPVLDSCDSDEIPAYLESSKERNLAFYARHGFRVTEEIELPDGPPVWGMWRDPRP
jgi:GNAT superfamily N-acetyltransferase